MKLHGYLVVLFLRSSNILRGERQPMANQGEILQEKLAPYMLSPVFFPTLVLLVERLDVSFEKFCSLSNASSSPPTSKAPPYGVSFSCAKEGA
jgi:hypothetical protein